MENALKAPAVPVEAARTTDPPAMFAGDEKVAWWFLEFFAVNIRNVNTRRAYLAAVRRFGAWCEDRGIGLAAVEPLVVAAYVEELGRVLAHQA